MTYLQLVNTVLRRLREPEVTNVNENAYSKLIGDFVNQTKREVEDSFNWNSLAQTIEVNTIDGIFNYTLSGAGSRFRVIDAYIENGGALVNTTRSHLNKLFSKTADAKGIPHYYGWNGISSSGDYQMDVYPVPDNAYRIFINVVNPQPILEENGTLIKVPYDPVILGAYAKAIRERGEDNGNLGAEVQAQYVGAISSAVAQEDARYPNESDWIPT